MKESNDVLEIKDTKQSKFKEFWNTVRKTSVPSLKQWWHSYWRVVLITVGIALVLIFADYGFSQFAIFAQSHMPTLDLGSLIQKIYIGALFVTGVLTAIGILIQRGTSDGLTSMFGSNVQFSTSISGVTKRIAKFTLIMGIIFAVLCFVSPLVLGGSFN